MPYYQYFKREGITPFIDLNGKGGRPPVYKNDFTIDKDGVPICPAGYRMRRNGIEVTKGRTKFKCPKMHRKTVAFPAPVNPLVPMQSMAEPFTWS